METNLEFRRIESTLRFTETHWDSLHIRGGQQWPGIKIHWYYNLYDSIGGCWVQIWKNFSDISHRKKVLLVMEVSRRPASDKWPLSVTKLFFYERYQKNSFRFGFSTHKIYNKIFISKFFEAINFSASVVWRPRLWRPPVFLSFELEQFRDQFRNPWKILHNPSYPRNWISKLFLKGPTLLSIVGTKYNIFHNWILYFLAGSSYSRS